MRTVMLVLLSAATLLLQTHNAASKPVTTEDFLNHIFTKTEECNASLIQNKFVEEVSYLTEGDNGCKDKFFCKVQQIMNETHNVCKAEAERALRNQLKQYNRHMKIDCAATLHGVNTTDQIQVRDLFEKVVFCVRRRKWHSNKKN